MFKLSNGVIQGTFLDMSVVLINIDEDKCTLNDPDDQYVPYTEKVSIIKKMKAEDFVNKESKEFKIFSRFKII